MKLDDLLARAYDILGDDRDDPRFFARARLVELINQGNIEFRSRVEDALFRANEPVVASQAVYTVPDGCVRIRRIAFDDETVPPKTILELVALDDKWQVRSGNEPMFWTSDSYSHDEYRYYETPDTSTSDPPVFTADSVDLPNAPTSNKDLGVIVQYDESGTKATFETDSANVGHTDEELGMVLSITSTVASGVFSVPDSDGIVTGILATFQKQTELWCVERPQTLVGDGEDVPIKNAYQKAGLWYALWHTYEEEEDHHNPVLAGFYKNLWNDEVARATMRASNPTPYMIRVLGTLGLARNPASGLRYPNSADFGSGAQNLVWGRRTRRW